MTKRIFIAALAAVFVTAAAAASGSDGGSGDWGFRAQSVQDGPLPWASCYTNDVVYGTPPLTTTTQIEFSCTVKPNGSVAPRTFYVYLRNMRSGAVRYINVNDGLLDEGEITDLSGNPGDAPVAFAVPNVEDFKVIGAGGLAAAIPAADLTVDNYQLVLELRNTAGTVVVSRGHFGFAVVDGVVPLTENISSDATFTSNNAYFIDDVGIFVEAGNTLTIQPGTFILGQGQLSLLAVLPGARIVAEGTAARPIVMTSAAPVGQRERAQWGGLVLNGNAPINVPGGTAQGEGDSGPYGGDDPDDSSGVLRYVRIEFAGIEFSPDNELNGIAFQGVGRGTVVEHVQIHFNKDDGVEFFGGTAQAKYLLLTADADDSLDWTQGWTGKVQFVVAQQRGDDADQGIEADNNANNNDLLPRAHPTIYNVTLLGAPTNADGTESDLGVLLREGTAGTLRNLIVMGFKEEGVDIDHTATRTQAQDGTLTFRNSIFWNNAGGNDSDSQFTGEPDGDGDLSPFSARTFMTAAEGLNRVLNPRLRDPFNTVAPDFRPELDSPARNVNWVANPPDDGFFEPVDFTGGVNPLHDWTQDWWTNFVPF